MGTTHQIALIFVLILCYGGCDAVNYSGKQTIRSLFGLHNETANIWSHFLGAEN
jgi:hypothetical protein